ncbi:kinase [Sphingomonas sp. ASY06-1R]|jgi:D-glycerate 3-kinase|uniref:kinase n=1 Tax=Sphingomonas sp. ASY06-1R TaxID=3445771 RepID=UPI003FA1F04C
MRPPHSRQSKADANDPAGGAASLIERALRAPLSLTERSPFVIGLCGAQGAGKSTVALELAETLQRDGLACAILSLDDLYKTKSDRALLARQVHPLLATRGPPGTHDVALGLNVLQTLGAGAPALLPRFDKAIDDRRPELDWDGAPADTRILILEGWFVGARPEPAEQLASPINLLERDEDPDGAWRTYVNNALARDYRQLFARLDWLILLAAPDFSVVESWRRQQEHALRASRPGGMTDHEIHRFIQHYERLTRHILSDMPGYADMVIRLDRRRNITDVEYRS